MCFHIPSLNLCNHHVPYGTQCFRTCSYGYNLEVKTKPLGAQYRYSPRCIVSHCYVITLFYINIYNSILHVLKHLKSLPSKRINKQQVYIIVWRHFIHCFFPHKMTKQFVLYMTFTRHGHRCTKYVINYLYLIITCRFDNLFCPIRHQYCFILNVFFL